MAFNYYTWHLELPHLAINKFNAPYEAVLQSSDGTAPYRTKDVGGIKDAEKYSGGA